MENFDKNLKIIYLIGGIATILVVSGIILDIIIGSSTGGNLTTLPQTAVERFVQFQQSKWFGLYNLDFLNTLVQLITIPTYLALFLAHYKNQYALSLLGLIIFLVGTIIFITSNSALPMLELSNKYALATSNEQKVLYAAAGEALLARGAHGSLGVFFSFLIPNIGGLVISIAMLKGKVFSATNSWLGILGSALLLVYVILVTFAPSVREMATLVAMPGGLMLLAWMIMITIRLFSLSK